MKSGSSAGHYRVWAGRLRCLGVDGGEGMAAAIKEAARSFPKARSAQKRPQAVTSCKSGAAKRPHPYSRDCVQTCNLYHQVYILLIKTPKTVRNASKKGNVVKFLAISAVVVKAVFAAALISGFHAPSHGQNVKKKFILIINNAVKGSCRSCEKNEKAFGSDEN
jgi:hypothetical protein